MLFEEQISRKPDHYPWTKEFIDAIWSGFWTPDEFNFRTDYSQFKTELNEQEKEIIVRALSAIGQIEVAVKTFWADVGKHLPHPSISDLGYAMANSEVVHNMAYEKLLDVLQLTHVFEKNMNEEVIRGRVNYLKKYLDRIYADDRKQYIYSIALFTLFVENVSLFSQFYIVLHFNRNRGILKDVAQQVQYTMKEECLIEGTEVLTPQGWRDVLDMKVGDPVYQYEEDGNITETTVQNTVARHHEGEMIRFSRKGNECIVTPNHDMIVHREDGMRKIKAKDLKMHKKNFIPRTANISNDNDKALTDMERLRIAVQADANRTYYTNKEGEKVWRGENGGHNYLISIKKDRKVERLERILKNTGLSYSHKTKECEDGSENHLYYISMDNDHDYKTFEWVDLTSVSLNWCEEFIEELGHWDGWFQGESTVGYCSTVRENVDVAQAVGILAGYNTHIVPREDNRKESYKDSYRVYFSKRNPLPASHSLKKEIIEDFSGMVGCVTVPSGAIITRLGEDTFITGNCLHSQVGIKLINTLREEYPDLFDKELEDRIAEECVESLKAESKVIDWMIGDYAVDGLDAEILKAFVSKRMKDSLEQIGFDHSQIKVDKSLVDQTFWLDESLLGATMTDFFQKRPVEYSKGQGIGADELF